MIGSALPKDLSTISMEYLTIEEMIGLAHLFNEIPPKKRTDEQREYLTLLTKNINTYIKHLDGAGVKIMGNPTDEPYIKLAKTIQEIERCKAAIPEFNYRGVASEEIQARIEAALKKIQHPPRSVEEGIAQDNSIDEIISLYLQGMNRSLDEAVVYLCYQGLPRIPDSVWKRLEQNEHLVGLALHGNRLRHIPDRVGVYLTGLTELGLSHNQLDSLPATLGNLGLTRFDIRGNPLLQRQHSIPATMRTLLENTTDYSYADNFHSSHEHSNHNRRFLHLLAPAAPASADARASMPSSSSSSSSTPSSASSSSSSSSSDGERALLPIFDHLRITEGVDASVATPEEPEQTQRNGPTAKKPK